MEATISEPEVIEVKIEKDSMDSWNWEEVDNSYRTLTRAVDLKNEITEALVAGKTLRIDKKHRIDRLYRWARANKLSLKRRGFTNFSIIWIENDSATKAE